jgi:hypothetical protein
MRAAVIGASSESIYGISKAKELGLEVIALDGNPEAPGLAAADKSFVVDIRDPEKVKEILDENRPEVIIPVPIGRYLTTTGVINDNYGLMGVSAKAAALCTDKYEFHRVLAEKNLRKAELYLVPAGETCMYAEELNDVYPVVVKPRFGSGSRGVEVFNSPEELQSGFLSGLPFDEDYVIETCVPGPEYGVDGVFVDGEFNLIVLRGKENTPPPYRECVGYYSISENKDNERFFNKLRSLMQSVGEAMGFTNNIIHADIIDNNGDPFIIETSARPSGHNLHNLFTPMASGVDEVTEFIKMAVPGLSKEYSFKPTVSKDMMIRYFDFENVVVTKVPDKDSILEKYPVVAWNCNIKQGDRLAKVTNGASIMGRGFFVIEAGSKDELDHIAKEILGEFETEEA